MPNQLQRYLDLDRLMAEQDVILAYRDVITEETIQHILSITDLRLTIHGSDKKLRKRIFNILVECLQNIVNHSDKDEGASSGLLVIGQTDGKIFIRTGNVMRNSLVPAFQLQLDYVNALEPDTIRQHYVNTLENTHFSEKGGAGLGLMDIYKRSGNPIRHAVHSVDEHRSFLSLHIEVADQEA